MLNSDKTKKKRKKDNIKCNRYKKHCSCDGHYNSFNAVPLCCLLSIALDPPLPRRGEVKN